MSRYTFKHLNHSCSFSLLQTTITTADQRWVSFHLLDMKSLPDSAKKILKNIGFRRRQVIDFLQYDLVKHMNRIENANTKGHIY